MSFTKAKVNGPAELMEYLGYWILGLYTQVHWYTLALCALSCGNHGLRSQEGTDIPDTALL